MKYIEIGKVKINYHNSQIKEVMEALTFIKKNNYLVKELFSVNKCTINISEFENYLIKALLEFINNPQTKQILKDKDNMASIYLKIYGYKKETNGEKNDINIDLCNLFAALEYYKNDVYEILKYLKRENKEEISNWVKEEKIYDIYNLLIKKSSNYIEKNEPILDKNMDVLHDLLFDEKYDYLYNEKELPKIKLPKIKEEEFENLFKEFLKHIKAPKTWYEEFDKLNKADKIEFNFTEDSQDLSHYIKGEKENNKIIISTKNTIECFVAFIHEFIHYLSSSNQKYKSLEEFPSIFYEMLAADFISKKYDQELKCSERRKHNNNYIKNYLQEVIFDIISYRETNQIDKKANNENMKKSILDNSNIDEEQYDLYCRLNCESHINRYLKYDSIIEGYQYIIGTKLSCDEIENIDERKLQKMAYVVENKDKYDLISILKYLGIETEFKQSKPNILKRLKNLTEKR